jgi:hypothetical protein
MVYFTAIWYILWPFGTFCDILDIFFPRFGMLYQEKSGSPVRKMLSRKKDCNWIDAYYVCRKLIRVSEYLIRIAKEKARGRFLKSLS